MLGTAVIGLMVHTNSPFTPALPYRPVALLIRSNQEHVELVRQYVMCKIEKEETENELVRYKMMYAELSARAAS